MSFEIKIKDACTLSSDKTITAREALALSNFPKKEAVVACRVNREQRPLSWELVMDSYIEFITTDSIEGIEVYTRTLAFLLTAAATRVLGVRLHLTQSMLYSYFYESPERELSEEDCAALRAEMRRMIAEDEPIRREVYPIDVARAMMSALGYSDKEELLRYAGTDPVILYRCGGVYDFFGGALADRASLTPTFELHPYRGGLFISGPTLSDPCKTMPFSEYRVLAVEPRRRHERYEELRAAGVRPRVRHREHAGLVVAQPLAELVLDDVARAAGAVALRAAALDHELVDDAVEGQPVVEALLREVGEVLDRVRREVVVKLDLERAVVRLKHRGLSRGLGGLRRLRREGGERRRRDHCAESKNFHHGSPPFRHVDQLLHFII